MSKSEGPSAETIMKQGEHAALADSKSLWREYGGTGPELYERYLVPAIFGPWAGELVEFAFPQPGERILDVACGTGIIARLASRRVRPSGRVVGLDLNPAMLAVARSMSSETNIDWREGDATAMALPDAAFDLVLCQQGLQFFPDRLRATREMHRVLVPGGRVVLSTWAELDESPGFAKLAEALKHHIGPEAGAVMKLPFSLSKREELQSVVSEAGFRRVKIQDATRKLNFPSSDEFVRRYVSASPLASLVGRAETRAKEALLEEMNEALQPYIDAQGVTFLIKTHFVVANA